jgi:aldose 1-epimerase
MMKAWACGLAALSACGALPALAHEVTATRGDGGKLADGTPTEAIVLSTDRGISARILSYGATLQALIVPDRNGKPGDIVLGHDTSAEYEAKQAYFGATVGRYANRIAGGRFTLDGKTFQLPLNDTHNSLHGGGHAFDRAVWRVVSVKSGASGSVVLEHVSPDGENGYPGEVDARVTYSMDASGALTISFDATTTKPTVLNMTNHALYSLPGACPANGATNVVMAIPASRYTPVNEDLIPTGELRPVAGTPFDFTKGRNLAAGLRDGHDAQIRVGRGYDHNFVLDKGATAEPGLAARVVDPQSGRVLEILTTDPGVQLYTGNFLDGTDVGKNGCVYRMGDGVALEPQKFPDTPNQPKFGSARVDPGKPYHEVMIIRTSTLK